MTTDLERLVVSLEANIKQYERELARSRSVTDKAMREVERSVSQGVGRLESRLGGLGGGVGKTADKLDGQMSQIGASIRTHLVGMLASVSVGTLVQFAEANTRIQNSLKVAGLEGDKLKGVYNELFEIAQRQGVPIEALAGLYSKASQAQRELGVTSQELTRFTDGVATALRIAGKSTEEASGALQQLGQLLSSDKVQAEEFNSVLDGAYPVLQAVANGLEEAGGSVAKLKGLVSDGEVSAKAFFRAFEAGQPSLEKLAASTVPTLSQQMTRLLNEMTRVAGELDRMVGATDLAGNAINGLVGIIAAMPEQLGPTIREITTLIGLFNALATAIARASSNKYVVNQEPIEESGYDPLVIRVKAKAPRVDLPDSAAPRAPISLKDFPVAGDGKGAKGGADKSSSERVDDYEREVKAIGERTAAFDREREALDKSAFEAAKADASFKLLAAAKEANVPVTDELRGKVEALSTAYAQAKVSLDEAEKKQREFESNSREVGSALSQSFSDAVVEGEKLNDVLSRLIKTLASRGIDRIFDDLFSKGGVGSDLLGGVIGAAKGEGFSLNPTGRAAGGPVKAGVPYVVGESGREVFVPTSPGRIVSNGSIGQGSAGQGVSAGQTIHVSMTVQALDAPSFARSEAQITGALYRAVQRGARGR